jgi:hypothetical protein
MSASSSNAHRAYAPGVDAALNHGLESAVSAVLAGARQRTAAFLAMTTQPKRVVATSRPAS